MAAITSSKRGFTLIELMTVITIMAVMMGVAVAAWLDWSRGAGMRSSLLDVQSSLALTRQWAITHRVRTQYVYGNVVTSGVDRGFYTICTNNSEGVSVPVGNVSLLADNIVFTNYVKENGDIEDRPDIVFKLDGTSASSEGSEELKFELVELYRATPLRARITVYPLTGRTKAEPVVVADDGHGGGGGGGR